MFIEDIWKKKGEGEKTERKEERRGGRREKAGGWRKEGRMGERREGGRKKRERKEGWDWRAKDLIMLFKHLNI